MRIIVAFLAWTCLLAAGMVSLALYDLRPGSSATAPMTWPGESRIVRNELPTLLVFLHPRCPCSRATVSELNRLIARHGDALSVVIVVARPSATELGWEESDILRSARAIPGAVVQIDRDLRETALFGAYTSGQVLLYGNRDQLLFQGGLTPSRGHQGDNQGSSAIVHILLQPTVQALDSSPVFGCELGTEEVWCGSPPCQGVSSLPVLP